MIQRVTSRNIADAVRELGQSDPHLGQLHDQHGIPPLWDRSEGFATLVHIILEQQVSLASARAAFDRLGETLGEVTPSGLLSLDDESLRRIGFSRQKTRYTRILANAVQSGALNLAELGTLPDEKARQTLMRLKGVGKWTADIYLLMALLRADVWPEGDLALAVAVQQVKKLASRPSQEELIQLAEPWRPWRSVAARMLWQHYLVCLRAPSVTTSS